MLRCNKDISPRLSVASVLVKKYSIPVQVKGFPDQTKYTTSHIPSGIVCGTVNFNIGPTIFVAHSVLKIIRPETLPFIHMTCCFPFSASTINVSIIHVVKQTGEVKDLNKMH